MVAESDPTVAVVVNADRPGDECAFPSCARASVASREARLLDVLSTINPSGNRERHQRSGGIK